MAKSAGSTPEVFRIRDLGFASAAVACGWSPRLDKVGDVVYFCFAGDSQAFRALEASYWTGELKLPAQHLLATEKSLKNRLYEVKNRP
jgi:hypothetical protein